MALPLMALFSGSNLLQQNKWLIYLIVGVVLVIFFTIVILIYSSITKIASFRGRRKGIYPITKKYKSSKLIIDDSIDDKYAHKLYKYKTN